MDGCKKDFEEFDIEYVVNFMVGMFGSDIKEVCWDVVMVLVWEYMCEYWL